MSAPTDDDAPSHGLEWDLPPTGTGVRAARRAAAEAAVVAPAPVVPVRPRPDRRWSISFAGAMAACVVAAVALTAVGVVTLRDSRAGRSLTNAQPDEPGFEGFLEPTPTLAVVYETDGELQSAALLALATGDVGGSIVLVPTQTVVGEGRSAATLGEGHAFAGGVEQTQQGLQVITGVGVTEVVAVDDDRWAELLGPLGGVTVQNPDELDGFPAGPVLLAPQDVGRYLSAQRDDESELARLVRHETFWRAWVAAVAERPDAVPGELDAGLGRFVRGLAGGQLEVATIPVASAESEFGQPEFVVDRVAIAAVMTVHVPYPLATPFAPRTLVRLLDGTGDPDHVTRVAPTVVAAAASIVVVGNAGAFDHDVTEIRYHAPGQRAAAERLHRALGVGTIIEDVRPIDSFDVTIVLGTDV